jgi:adenine-specific DNA methylase
LETEKSLIEEWLPLKEVNFDVDIEMAFKFLSKEYRNKFKQIYGFEPEAINTVAPRIRNLHLWLARRPSGAARVLTSAAILSSATNKETFKAIVGLNEIPHLIDSKLPPIMMLVNPKKDIVAEIVQHQMKTDPKNIVIVDPMAGGGSIPLESLRLGLRTVAMDYNPVAYLILKATLEYPARYGLRLWKDVREEAKKFAEFAKNELGKYYSEEARMRAIIARGFECPNCNGLVPIIHGTRLRGNGPYIRFQFDKKEKIFKIDIVNEETDYEKLRCPYCKRPLTKDEVFTQWATRHKEILKIALNGDVLEAQKCKGKLLRIHIPLLQQVKTGFAPCKKEDEERFFSAYLDLAKQAKRLKIYLPSSPIPKENSVFGNIKKYGIDYWYEMYNPRQLLVFLKLVEYMSNRVKELVKNYQEYGAAIALYLVFGLNKLLNYNNIATMWHTRHGVIKGLDASYSASRSVSLGLEYCEAHRIDLAINWSLEPNVEKLTATGGGICPLLMQLCNWLQGSGNRVEVFMGDAREMCGVMAERSVDQINVDPPYFDQHSYSDFSEFFWQSLMLAMKPAIDFGFLFNRDKSRGKVECLVSGWSPSLPTVPRTGEIVVRKDKRKMNVAEFPFTKDWWKEQMWKFFSEAYKALKDEGTLILWYTHSDPAAWEAVLSGVYASKFLVSNVWNIKTEMRQRQVALTSSAFFTSLVLIARKRGEGVIVGERNPKELLLNEAVKEVITESVAAAIKSARVSGATDREAYVMALAGAIAGATRIHNPALESFELNVASETLNQFTEDAREEQIAKSIFRRTSEFFRESLYPVALYLGASKVLENELIRAGLSEEEIKLVIGSDDLSRSYLVFWLSTRYIEKGIEPLIDYDFAEKICKVVGAMVSSLEACGLIRKLGKNAYAVLFGQEVFDAVKNRIEVLDRTVTGAAIYLLKMITDSPIKDEPDKCAKYVLTKKPVSKQAIATAMFLLKTASDDELRKASISPLSKPFVERVLKALYER